ncbi:hypothetical protein HYU21_03555 [Candidatus Woesearchaeota archaeon]|nr:hypothetical protein [Candidatus Woesearchaeota archaeon]
MDLYKLKWTTLQVEIFSLLCSKSAEKLSQREIAILLKVSPTAVGNSIKKLNEIGLVSLEKMKTINLISFNRDNPKAIRLKRVENLKKVYESGLFDFLYNEFPGCTIILFGSYSLGEDVHFGKKDERNSDIDIAIIGMNGKKVDLEFFEKKLERIISINFYKSWSNIHKNLKDNILGGIMLSGDINL